MRQWSWPGGRQLPGRFLPEGRCEGENPGGDHVGQQFSRAGPRARHGDIRRDLRVQVDARGGFAGSGAQVEPADYVLRVRVQVEHPRQRRGTGKPGAEAEGVASALVIGRDELAGDGPARTRRLGIWSRLGSVHPAGHREPAALRGLQVREQARVAADLVAPDPDHLPDRHHPPRCRP
jgi:hypothetical protein